MGIGRVRGRALLVTAVALGLAAGCSNAGGSANAARPEKPVITVAVVPAVDSAGFFVALDQGLFKAQGLTVNFIPISSSETAIADQVSGAYDITGGNYVSYIQAQQKHEANLDIFAEGSVMEPGTQGIYTLPDSPVTTLADLRGQTVAINAPDNILFLLTASVLAEHGVSLKSVHFASIPFPEMPAELKSDAVSAAVMPEPYASGAEEAQGGMPLAGPGRLPGRPENFRGHGSGVIRRGGRRRTRADKDMRRLGGVFNMSADANIKTIMSVYEAFGRGDVAAILDAVTDDVDWAAEAAGSAAPWYGVRHGKDAVRAFFAEFGSTMEVEEFTPVSIAANDTDVLSVVRFRARSRATGTTAAMDLHHLFTFRDGKIAYYRGTEDTAQTQAVLQA